MPNYRFPAIKATVSMRSGRVLPTWIFVWVHIRYVPLFKDGTFKKEDILMALSTRKQQLLKIMPALKATLVLQKFKSLC